MTRSEQMQLEAKILTTLAEGEIARCNIPLARIENFDKVLTNLWKLLKSVEEEKVDD